jgi:hypothetical protein
MRYLLFISLLLVSCGATVSPFGDEQAGGVVSLGITGNQYNVIPAPNAPNGTTQTIDWTSGNVQVLELEDSTGDVTLTLSNPVAGGTYYIKIIQNDTARLLVWPAAVKWSYGSAPVITATDNAIDLVTLFYDGTIYLSSITQDYR